MSKLHTYDYLILIIIGLVILLGFRECSRHGEGKVNDIDNVAQEKIRTYDSVILAKNSDIETLKTNIEKVHQEKAMIIVKYKSIHDTIEATPDVDSLQIRITKKLCPSDSFDIKQVNLCLEEGLRSAELYYEATQEISLKDKIIDDKNVIIFEDERKFMVADSLATEYKTNNERLSKDLEKQKHRKKGWRTAAAGFGLVIAALLLVH